MIASTGAWILEPVDHYRQNVTGQHKLCRLPARAGHQTETIAETTLARSTIRRAGPGSIRSLSGWVEGTRTLNLRLMRPMPYLFWPRPKEWSAFPSIRSSTQKRGGPGGIRTHRLPILRRAHVPILLRGFWPAREESNLQRTELQPAALPLELRADKLTITCLGGRIRTSEHPDPNRGVNQTHLRPDKSKNLRLEPSRSRKLHPTRKRRLILFWYPGRESNPHSLPRQGSCLAASHTVPNPPLQPHGCSRSTGPGPGIEPGSLANRARVLPLDDSRSFLILILQTWRVPKGSNPDPRGWNP